MRGLRTFAVLKNPMAVALGVTLLFSLRFFYGLPFSGYSKIFNQEGVASFVSFLMFAQESWSFPLGEIKGIAFPFADGNIGNVGAIPLFALFFKALGTLFPYFQTFDYFHLINVLSCLLTAYFAQKTLLVVGVRHFGFLVLGALLTGTSMLMFMRTSQPFCIVAFPIFTAWLYGMLLLLQRSRWKFAQDVAILSVYPIAALLDSYSLFAILLGTSVVLFHELVEAYLGGSQGSINRSVRLFFLCTLGPLLSVSVLYVIGMYPWPSAPVAFTSYDFGMGGRYHVADLLSPWLPIGSGDITKFSEQSLLGRLGFPFTTKFLTAGQAEGAAYIGTSAILIWIFVVLNALHKRYVVGRVSPPSLQSKLKLQAPWRKVGWASLGVFIFSLGYELHILGRSFPNFSGMPGAWVADWLPTIYNIRAPGRLASLLSIFLILEGIRQLSLWCDRRPRRRQCIRLKRSDIFVKAMLAGFIVIHLVEIIPFLKPIPVQSSLSLAGWSKEEVEKIRRIGLEFNAVLISPSWRKGLDWETKSYSLAYYLGIRSNIYLIARTLPNHEARIARDREWVTRGRWDELIDEYGEKILLAIPGGHGEELRSQMSDRYKEVQVGGISLWSKRLNTD